MTESTLQEVLNEIAAERLRQDAKWGEQNHEPIEWMSILMEEVGEASKEALELHFHKAKEEHPDKDWIAQKRANYRMELVQVAAVAVAMLECFDRNTPAS